MNSRFSKVLCFFVLSIILVAGLWPLHAPKNQVQWREQGTGLEFGRFGTVVSRGGFRTSGSQDGTLGSIEICVEPAELRRTHTILSFDGSDHPGSPLSIRQYKDALVVTRYNVDDLGVARTAWMRVDSIFLERKPAFITVTLNRQGTSVYLNGTLAKMFPISGISENNLTGRLVLANSPFISDGWAGSIFGLAIYGQELTPKQVSQHYQTWRSTQSFISNNDSKANAVYEFNEHGGDLVHNRLDAGTDLLVPARYTVLHPPFLSSPTREYKATWSYLEDVLVNVAGFIPFGFAFVAYLSNAKFAKWPAITTVMIGLATSLTIEVFQTFLPTRSSGTTDLFTNTLGTAIGVWMYRWPFVQRVIRKVNLHGPGTLQRVNELSKAEAPSKPAVIETSTLV